MKKEEEKKEISQLNNLEGFEKTNSELTTIKDIKELNDNKDKYQRISLSHNKLIDITEY